MRKLHNKVRKLVVYKSSLGLVSLVDHSGGCESRLATEMRLL